MRENSSPSFFNPHEVLVVKKYVQALREDQRLRLREYDLLVNTVQSSPMASPRGLADWGDFPL